MPDAVIAGSTNFQEARTQLRRPVMLIPRRTPVQQPPVKARPFVTQHVALAPGVTDGPEILLALRDEVCAFGPVAYVQANHYSESTSPS